MKSPPVDFRYGRMTTPSLYTDITATHGQPAIGASEDACRRLVDIEQSILIILTTPKGADAHRQRPSFVYRLTYGRGDPAFAAGSYLRVEWKHVPESCRYWC